MYHTCWLRSRDLSSYTGFCTGSPDAAFSKMCFGLLTEVQLASKDKFAVFCVGNLARRNLHREKLGGQVSVSNISKGGGSVNGVFLFDKESFLQS